jgi:hypothetical protein
MSSIHDVTSCGLSEVVQLTNDRTIVEVTVERGCIFESVELHGNLCREWFHLSIGQVDISYDGIDQGMLCKLVGSIMHLLDVDSHVISWMSLIFDVEANVLVYRMTFLSCSSSLPKNVPSST